MSKLVTNIQNGVSRSQLVEQMLNEFLDKIPLESRLVTISKVDELGKAILLSLEIQDPSISLTRHEMLKQDLNVIAADN
jgi:C4-type Zn-finger protein